MGSSQAFYGGQFLIAMPGMMDPRFDQTVIYMCAHTEEGAMGLVINRPADDLDVASLLVKLGIIDEAAAAIELPESLRRQSVLVGGPVEPTRGFVLHSTDYFRPEGTLPISASVGLTATLEILKDMAQGRGPEHALLALGYAGWAPGQLESEMAQNAWLTCEADEDILFHTPLEKRYEKALARLGIDPGFLSADAGHA